MSSIKKELKRRNSKRQEILSLLKNSGDNGITNTELSKISLRYGAHIGAFYEMGYVIKKVDMGNGVFKYIFVSNPPKDLSKKITAKDKLVEIIDEMGSVDSIDFLNILEENGINVKYKANTHIKDNQNQIMLENRKTEKESAKVLYFMSMTGITRNFTKGLDANIECVEIKKGEEVPISKSECYLLVYTHLGKSPIEAYEFVEKNQANLLGVIGFGDRMWGRERFCRGAKDISSKYNVKYLRSIERSGDLEDKKFVESLFNQK